MGNSPKRKRNPQRGKPGGKAYTAPKSKATPSRAAQGNGAGGSTKRSAWILGVGIAAVVIGLLVFVSTRGGEEGDTDRDAWDLPALDADNDPDGDGRVTLAEFEGTPLVVNFFASWCTNCAAELPRFVAAEGVLDGEVAFVYVNSNETGNWKPMAEEGGIRDALLVKDIKGGNGNGLYRSFGGTGGMPMTAFYDDTGNVVAIDRGELSTAALTARLQELGAQF